MTLPQYLRDQFNQPIFDPVDCGRANTRNSSFLVTGFAEENKVLLMLSAVGIASNIDLLIGACRAQASINLFSIQTATGRTNLGRMANTEFEIKEVEIQNYGIKSVIVTNRDVLRAGALHPYFAANNVEDAVGLAGERVRALLDTSVLPIWYEYIFRSGVDNSRIRRVNGIGLNVYKVDNDQVFWQSVISSGLAQGLINIGA